MAHEHDYRKLSDEAVFCRGCGDIKTAEPAFCTLPHYPIYPYIAPMVWPPNAPWTPTPWWGTTTTGSVTVLGTTTGYPAGAQVTYTADSLS